MSPKIDTITPPLLDWYDRHQRHLPWRARPGEIADPYHVWLSEIMLQQTTVVTVGPYFTKFLKLWPRVADLAAAPLDDVLARWAGLGYYARARNLHKCARVIADQYGGRFPDTEEGLLTLPGIGPYTAAAISAIAFGRPTSPVDGNIERVVARLFAIETPMPDAKPELTAQAATLTPPDRPGDHAQAMMDLGATICTPRKPKCLTCPISAPCLARQKGIAENLPHRRPKAAKPTRHGVAFWMIDSAGQVCLRRRPERGLLGGMMEIPSTDWQQCTPGEVPDLTAARASAPLSTDWRELPGIVRHTFTHFHLELTVWAARAETKGDIGTWHQIDAISDLALPTVMAKVAAHAVRHTA
jgi:A/G-specific adenine glycosylase